MMTILFGSGADTDYCRELPSGRDFSKELLIDGFKEERKMILGDNAVNFRLIYPTSKNVFLQTICEYEDEAIRALGKDAVKKAVAYYRRKAKEDAKNVISECVSNLCKEWYDATINGCGKTASFFLNNALFFDSLDEKFNALRKTPVEAKGLRVINAYYTILFLMLHKLYCDSFLSLDLKKLDFEWLLNLLNRPYEIQTVNTEGSYYNTVKEAGLNCCIATTNYTNLVFEAVNSEMQDKTSISFLHGKLSWFEDLEDLTVYDAESDDERKIMSGKDDSKKLIPFILIPSGVKPIICRRQLDEFYKFSCMLDKSDIVCTIGYRFNLEDNHINSLIVDWLKKNDNNRLVYFNFDGNVDVSKYIWLRQFNVIQTRGDLIELKTLMEGRARAIDVLINKENARQVFSAFIKMINAMNRQTGR